MRLAEAVTRRNNSPVLRARTVQWLKKSTFAYNVRF
jgi:hypothetical protein